MKILICILLWFNTIAEFWFGLNAFIRPNKIYEALRLPSVTEAYALVPRMYGNAAICIALLSLLLIIKLRKNETDFLKPCLFVFGCFHTILAIILYVENPNWLMIAPPHIIVGLLFFLATYSTKNQATK